MILVMVFLNFSFETELWRKNFALRRKLGGTSPGVAHIKRRIQQ
jgi:hypothetical protein